jgi:transposase
MSATSTRRASDKQATASRHSHAPFPSREDLQRQVERQQLEIDKFRQQVAERDRQIAEAEKQIADLERQLASRKKNSTNSSKPPSSDGLSGESRPRGRRKKSKRKPGGQKGRPGHKR